MNMLLCIFPTTEKIRSNISSNNTKMYTYPNKRDRRLEPKKKLHEKINEKFQTQKHQLFSTS